jgi:hypothetical protein
MLKNEASHGDTSMPKKMYSQNQYYIITNHMKEKKELYETAMQLLESCNFHLKDDPQLPTLNIHMSSVVKNLGDIVIKEITNLTKAN